MKCVVCRETAEYQYNGNTYCGKCYIERQQADEYSFVILRKMLDIIGQEDGDTNSEEYKSLEKKWGNLLSGKKEDEWWEKDLK